MIYLMRNRELGGHHVRVDEECSEEINFTYPV